MRGGVDPYAVMRIARLLMHGYDVLHLHTSNAHTLGYLASFLTSGVKVVVSRRVSFPVKGFFRRLKYKGVDKVIAVSEEVRNDLIQSGISPEAVVAIHSAIDIGRYKAADEEPSHPVVGIVAHLAEHKGHIYFLEAAKKVSTVIPDARFLIVGDGEKRKELEKYVKDLDIAEKVIFAGFQKDIPKMISQCTITVLSSISGEGSPGVLKESMAAGVPAITTDVGGSREIVECGVSGFVVSPGDSEALAASIIKLLSDKELRARMRQESLVKVQEFTTENMVEKTVAVYRGLLTP